MDLVVWSGYTGTTVPSDDLCAFQELARSVKLSTEWILQRLIGASEKEALALLRSIAAIPEISSGAFVTVVLYGIMQAALSSVAEGETPKGPNENFTTYCRAMALFEREIHAEDIPDLDKCRGLLRSAGVGMRWGVPGKDVCDQAVAGMLRAAYGVAEPESAHEKDLARSANSGPSAA